MPRMRAEKRYFAFRRNIDSTAENEEDTCPLPNFVLHSIPYLTFWFWVFKKQFLDRHTYLPWNMSCMTKNCIHVWQARGIPHLFHETYILAWLMPAGLRPDLGAIDERFTPF
jgi:hypothetical protein